MFFFSLILLFSSEVCMSIQKQNFFLSCLWPAGERAVQYRSRLMIYLYINIYIYIYIYINIFSFLPLYKQMIFCPCHKICKYLPLTQVFHLNFPLLYLFCLPLFNWDFFLPLSPFFKIFIFFITLFMSLIPWNILFFDSYGGTLL